VAAELPPIIAGQGGAAWRPPEAAGPRGFCLAYFDRLRDLAAPLAAPGTAKAYKGLLEVFGGSFYGPNHLYRRNVFANRMAPVISRLRALPSGARVLDCGCGCGYQSLLLALAGARVTGVDLTGKRVAIARRLAQAFSQGGASARAEFFHQGLFSFLEQRRGREAYDLVWISEAVSHIHPLEEFWPLLKEVMAPGALLAITEANVLNPLVRRQVGRERWDHFARRKQAPEKYRHEGYWLFPARFQDPATGQELMMANERMLSPASLEAMLRKQGFGGFDLYWRSFAPRPLYRLAGERACRVLERSLQATPLLQRLAAHYVLLARR
jgi:SAM-dependent methyltransferase